MAVRSKEEIIDMLKGITGEDTSDAVIAVLEDVTDTFDDLVTKSKDYIELESKYNELDASWRKRYTERFYNVSAHGEEILDPIDDIDDPDPEDTEEKITTFDGLFKEVE